MFCASLPAYLDGNLDDQEHVEMERHLESCAQCAAELERWTEVESAIHALPIHRQPPRPAKAAVDHLLRVAYARKTRPRLSRWLWIPAIGPTVAAVVILLWPQAEMPPTPVRQPLALSVVRGNVEAAKPGGARLSAQRGEALLAKLGPHAFTLSNQGSAEIVSAYSEDTRIRLLGGDIELDVAPRANGDRFEVEAGDYTASVVGTKFYVHLDAEGGVELGVSEGKVRVRKGQAALHSVTAGQRLSLVRGQEPQLLALLPDPPLEAEPEKPTPKTQATPARSKRVSKTQNDTELWRSWLASGNYEAVELALRQRFEVSPNDAEAWLGLGELRSYAGRWDGALDAYNKVMNLDRGGIHGQRARLGAARILVLHKREAERAKALMTKHLANRNPVKPGEALVVLARAEHMLGNTEAAQEHLRKVIVDHKSSPAIGEANKLLRFWNR